jgi:hypothetical protein
MRAEREEKRQRKLAKLAEKRGVPFLPQESRAKARVDHLGPRGVTFAKLPLTLTRVKLVNAPHPHLAYQRRRKLALVVAAAVATGSLLTGLLVFLR